MGAPETDDSHRKGLMDSMNGHGHAGDGPNVDFEWLETDGLGGFAASTVCGCNTRRYHGLLVSDPHSIDEHPPVGRRMLLNKVEETLSFAEGSFALSTNLYLDAIHPDGRQFVSSFTREPWPTITFAVPGAQLTKEVFMPHHSGVTVVRYTLDAAAGPAELAIDPLVSGRGFHHTIRASDDITPTLTVTDEQFSVQLFDDASRIFISHEGGEFRGPEDGHGGCWYYNFNYPIEAERGLDAVEDLYCPGRIRWTLQPGDSVALVVSTCPTSAGAQKHLDVAALAAAEKARRIEVSRNAGHDPRTQRLFLSADQFIIRRREGSSVVAGYPWFNDWGRDTMIALPGLTVATGHHDECRDVLRTWVSHSQDGLIPNVFGDDGSAAYNTADATLWMFAAVEEFYSASSDIEFIRSEMYDGLIASLRSHAAGTGHDVAMDPADGLLIAGDAHTQLTWMDAKVSDWTVTPRHGKPVEINALWYSALRTGQFFAEKLGDPATAAELGNIAVLCKRHFAPTFFDDTLGYCFDVITPDGPDARLRPNQLIACALPHSLLTQTQMQRVVSVCRDRLLTPYGMRTLSPDDDAYRGRYEGDVWARDGAYHQGTVWPWLIGPFLKAYRAAFGDGETTRAYMRECLGPLMEHLLNSGSIAEIFDGDEPQLPRGCPAQAWSVAQVLECWLAARAPRTS